MAYGILVGMTRQYAASKVPVITAWFWIIKVLTTAMGEATSDYLAHRFDPYIVVPLGGIALVLTLLLQLSVRRYITWVYWFTVVMVAIVGTMVADSLHIQFRVPYYQSTALFAVVLTCVFCTWYWSERTLSIHSIYTRRREMFYWATVLATFALGTAAGDWTARTLGLGFLSSGIMFAIVITVPAIGNWKLRMNPIAAFWFAYVVTRPLGASFADWMGLPKWVSGLGLGAGPVAIGLTIPIIIGVAYLGWSRKDVEEPGVARAPIPAVAGGQAHQRGAMRQAAPPRGRGRHRQSAGGEPVPQRVVAQVPEEQFGRPADRFGGSVGPYRSSAGQDWQYNDQYGSYTEREPDQRER